MIIRESRSLGDDEDRYEDVPDLVSVRPEKGAPQRTAMPADVIPSWDRTAKYAYHRRPAFSHDVQEVLPIHTSHTPFQDERPTRFKKGGIRVRGQREYQTTPDLDFKKVSEEPYSAKQDSTFRARTRPIKRQFAILPNLQPDGEYEMPSYELNNVGADILRVPRNMNFNQLDERLSGMGIDPFSILAVAKGATGGKKGGGLLKLFGKARKGLKKLKGGDGKAAAPEPSYTPTVAVTGGGLPGWAVPAMIGGGVLLLGGIIFMTMRR